MNELSDLIKIIKNFYNKDEIHLHEPYFDGNEKTYLLDTIDSTFVSSIGKYVNDFENALANYVGLKKSVCVSNGTVALQTAMKVVGVKPGDEVITQSLSFIGTANAISHNYANPIFIDVDFDTMSMSPSSLENFLVEYTYMKNGYTYNKKTGNKISCCVPVHVLGYMARIEQIVELCEKFNIRVVEDAAEALGSYNDSGYAGTYGDVGVFSFNGNKIITSGGGGAIVSKNQRVVLDSKHITTTAKINHQWEFKHDKIGYNFRMPNLNAALALSQLEKIENKIEKKIKLFNYYKDNLNSNNYKLRSIPKTTSRWNYWLMSLEANSINDRNYILKKLHESKIYARPLWNLISSYPMYKNCLTTNLSNSKLLQDKIVCIPSNL